jgi:hypothetical protein
MERVFKMSFASLYPLYVQKVEKKGRTKQELDQVLQWLLGLDPATFAEHLQARTTLRDLFAAAVLPSKADEIQGVVCGVRVELVEDPLMRNIRRMDKLVDELAKGRPLTKVMREG